MPIIATSASSTSIARTCVLLSRTNGVRRQEPILHLVNSTCDRSETCDASFTLLNVPFMKSYNLAINEYRLAGCG